MHLRWATVAPLLAGSIAVHAYPSTSFDSPYTPLAAAIVERDGHEHHNHNAAPLLVLNETEVTMYHAPTPPSYYTIDWEDEGYQQRHAGLMVAHGIFMGLAFFVSVPFGVFFSYIPS
jgi:hypothetical protein